MYVVVASQGSPSPLYTKDDQSTTCSYQIEPSDVIWLYNRYIKFDIVGNKPFLAVDIDKDNEMIYIPTSRDIIMTIEITNYILAIIERSYP